MQMVINENDYEFRKVTWEHMAQIILRSPYEERLELWNQN